VVCVGEIEREIVCVGCRLMLITELQIPRHEMEHHFSDMTARRNRFWNEFRDDFFRLLYRLRGEVLGMVRLRGQNEEAERKKKKSTDIERRQILGICRTPQHQPTWINLAASPAAGRAPVAGFENKLCHFCAWS
jgi:hypothetical protein